MEQTQIQKQIEQIVTNGIGYRNNSGYALRRLDEAIRYGQTSRDTELDLQMHLGGLEALTAENELTRNCFWRMVFELGEIRQDLEKVGLVDGLKTPEDVHRALMSHMIKYKIKQTEKEYKLIEFIDKDFIYKKGIDKSIPADIPRGRRVKTSVVRGLSREQKLETELEKQIRLSREAKRKAAADWEANKHKYQNSFGYVKEVGDDIRGSPSSWGLQNKD